MVSDAHLLICLIQFRSCRVARGLDICRIELKLLATYCPCLSYFKDQRTKYKDTKSSLHCRFSNSMVIFEYYFRLSFPLCLSNLVVNRTGYLNMYSNCLEFDIQYGFLTCPTVGYRAATNIIQTRY